nr:phage tail length tape measure family protein [Pseudomonas sp. AU12215]
MAGKDLELALRLRSDMKDGQGAVDALAAAIGNVGDKAEVANTNLQKVGTTGAVDQAQTAIDKLGQSLDNVGTHAAEAAREITLVGESADQQAARIKAMVTASLEQKSSQDAAAASARRLGDAVAAANSNWQANASAQTAAMNQYHNTEQSLAAQAQAQQEAAERAAAAAEAFKGQEAALGTLLGKIDPVIRELNRLDQMEEQLRGFKASGLLDQEGFDLYNRKLQEQRKRLGESSEAMHAASLSAGQYQQAIRQLPAQLTDVATSLATGMPLWMVAIQQGGQITDSFGGLGNSLKLLGDRLKSFFGIAGASADSGVSALGEELAALAVQQATVAKGSAQASENLADLAEKANTAAEATGNAQKAAGALSGAVSTIPTSYLAVLAAVTPLAIALGALSVAALKGIEDLNAFNKALIATGGFAGKTTSQLIDLRNELAGGEHFSEAQAAILALVENGRLAGDTFDAVAAAATEMAAATGKSAADVSEQFASARKDVVALAAELSSRYHVVTASTYEQIRALQEQGQSMDALRLLAGEVAGEMKRRNDEISESTRGIAKLWDDATNALGRYWAQLKGGVAADKDTFKLQVLRQQVEDIDKGFWFSTAGRDSLKKQYLDEIAVIEQRLRVKEDERKDQQQDQEANDKYIASSKALNAELDNSSPAKKRAAAIRDLNKEFMDLLASAERLGKKSPLLKGVNYDGKSFSGGAYDQLLKGIENRYKDPKTPKTSAGEKTAKQNEDWVKALEKEAATYGATKAARREYELEERNLTGALKARAEAAWAMLDAAEKQKKVDEQAKKDAKTLAQLNLDYLKASGQTVEAAGAEVEKKYGALRKRLEAAGNTEGAGLVSKLMGIEKAKAELDQVQQQVDRIFGEQSRQEQSIQTQQQTGLMSELGARQKLVDLHKATADQVEALLPKMKELAERTGDPQALERVKDLEAQLGTLRSAADQVTQALKTGLENGLQNALQGLATGTMNLKEAAIAFLQDIAKAMADVASQTLAQMASDKLGKLFQDTSAGTSMTTGAAAVSTSATELSAAGATLITGAAAISAAATSLGLAAAKVGVGGGGAPGAPSMQSIVDSIGAPQDVVSWPGAEAAASASADAIGSASAEGAAAMGDAITAASSQGSGIFGDALSSIFSGGADLFSSLFSSLGGLFSGGGAAGGGSLFSSILGGAGAAAVAAATGGHVRGPGTETSDSIPALLSDNEFVTRAAVVRQPGALGFLHDFNAYGMAALDDWARRVRHATGGQAGIPAPAMPAPTLPGGRAADPSANFSANVTNRLRIINAQDPEDAVRRQAETPAFEKAVLNIIGGNPSAVKELLG